MKKLLAFLLAAILVFALAACADPAQESGGKTEDTQAASAAVETFAPETEQPTEATFGSAFADYLDADGNVLFRAFLELNGEELVSLIEEREYEWYENEYVMSGFADEGKSNGFQKNYFGTYIQIYNSTSDYRSYEDIRAAGKGDAAKMAVAMNVKGEYQTGEEAVLEIFDGMETVRSWKDPKYGDSIGAVCLKDGGGTEYLVVYSTEFYSGGSAVVSLICRTNDYFAANPLGGADTIEAVWNQYYGG